VLTKHEERNKIASMDYSKLPEKMERALIEWRARQTRQRLSTSINAFANFLGYSRPIVTLWLNGDRKPTQETVERLLPKLIELIGSEAFEAFGLPTPDPQLQDIISAWPFMPNETRLSIHEQAAQYVTKPGETQPNGRTSESTT
jgi:DNA-binding transcriptional regulator YiaG